MDFRGFFAAAIGSLHCSGEPWRHQDFRAKHRALTDNRSALMLCMRARRSTFAKTSNDAVDWTATGGIAVDDIADGPAAAGTATGDIAADGIADDSIDADLAADGIGRP
jgi:hypothetical protein